MSSLKLALVGDTFVDRPRPELAFEHVRGLLQSADAAIGSHVGVASRTADVPAPTEQPRIVAPEMLEGLRCSGLRAVACANKHMVDGGHRAMLETLQLLQQAGIATAGAGPDLRSARAPAVFNAGGQSIGLLAYTSCFTKGYEARDAAPPIGPVPGIAPLRATTVYEPLVPNMWLPGYDPAVRVVHWPSDLAALEQDVAAAADRVDFLIVTVQQRSPRLGPCGVDEFERVAARRAIDAGAKAFFSAHHHGLRGAQFYRNAPIFHGLGDFIYDGVAARVDDRRHTTIAVLSIDERVRAAFIPAMIQSDGRPRPLDPGSVEGRGAVDHLRKCMSAVGAEWRLELCASFLAGFDALEIVPA